VLLAVAQSTRSDIWLTICSCMMGARLSQATSAQTTSGSGMVKRWSGEGACLVVHGVVYIYVTFLVDTCWFNSYIFLQLNKGLQLPIWFWLCGWLCRDCKGRIIRGVSHHYVASDWFQSPCRLSPVVWSGYSRFLDRFRKLKNERLRAIFTLKSQVTSTGLTGIVAEF
jgi:hypothetical protein